MYQHVKSFGFIAGYQTQVIKAQYPINIKAAKRMCKLHDPLKATRHVVCANAMQTDWPDVLPLQRCSYVLGNPPFLGKSNQYAAQKVDM